MFKRTLTGLVMASATLLATQTYAQQQPSAEDLQFFQQMQEFGQQVMTNMQQSGVNPQELFQDFAQQMQSGTFDPEAMQQMLMDKGIITPEMMNGLQATTRNYGLTRVRQQLNVSDEEWAVIQAKIQRILIARADVDINAATPYGGGGAARGVGGMMMGGQANQNGGSPAAKAWKDLRASLKDLNVADATLIAKLRAWRDAHEQAKKELAVAQEELLKVVTLRQEAILLRIGLL